MKERVTTKKAAEILGITPPQLRNLMKRGLLPIGQVFTPTATGKTIYTYYVYRNKLEKYIGRALSEEEINEL